MATEIWVNIGSCNGLLPDSTKPLPEQLLTYHLYLPEDNSHETFSIFILDTITSLKITNLRSQLHLPGANELTYKSLLRMYEKWVVSYAL